MRNVKPHQEYPQEEGRYLRGDDYAPAAVIIILSYDAEAIPPEIEKLVRAGICSKRIPVLRIFPTTNPLTSVLPVLEKQEVESTGREKTGYSLFSHCWQPWDLSFRGSSRQSPSGHDDGPIATGPDFNQSGVNPVNSTIPAKYQATPEPVRVEVTVSDTLIPGPKGEMQAGPRAIGFAADPVTLLVLAVAILAGAAGVWYLARMRPEEPEESAEEEEK